jgi:hypothetical protein
MIAWMMYWVWWVGWRSAVTVAAVLSIQHVIHEEQAIWIETKPLFIGAALTVLCIRIWSAQPHKE